MIQINKEIGFKNTKEEILNELVTETNYSLLNKYKEEIKSEELSIENIYKLITNSKDKIKLTEEKIIKFYMRIL